MDAVAEDDNNNEVSTVADAEAEAEAETFVVDVIVGSTRCFLIVDILFLEAEDLFDEIVEEDDFNEVCLSRFSFRSWSRLKANCSALSAAKVA